MVQAEQSCIFFLDANGVTTEPRSKPNDESKRTPFFGVLKYWGFYEQCIKMPRERIN